MDKYKAILEDLEIRIDELIKELSFISASAFGIKEQLIEIAEFSYHTLHLSEVEE